MAIYLAQAIASGLVSADEERDQQGALAQYGEGKRYLLRDARGQLEIFDTIEDALDWEEENPGAGMPAPEGWDEVEA